MAFLQQQQPSIKPSKNTSAFAAALFTTSAVSDGGFEMEAIASVCEKISNKFTQNARAGIHSVGPLIRKEDAELLILKQV